MVNLKLIYNLLFPEAGVRQDESYSDGQFCWDIGVGANVSLSDVEVPETRSTSSTSRNLEREFWGPSRESLNTLNNNKGDAVQLPTEEVSTDVSKSCWNIDMSNGILNSECRSPTSRFDLSPANASRTENETRPTVLMLAGSICNKNNAPQSPSTRINNDSKVVVVQQEDVNKLPLPEDNQKWLGALALMELAKTQEEEAVKALTLKKGIDSCDNINYTHL